MLKLRYGRAVSERDRIRGARAFFARQLGPLPTVAGISVAAVGAFSKDIKHTELLWAAFAVFVLMSLVSVSYSSMPPYRKLRERFEDKEPEPDSETPHEWYARELRLERFVYDGDPGRNEKPRVVALLPWRDGGLQDQLDRERIGVFATQFLFLGVVALLVAAH